MGTVSKRLAGSRVKIGIGAATFALLGAACVETPPAQPSGPGLLPSGESVYIFSYNGAISTAYKLSGDGAAGTNESFTSESAPPLPDYLSDGLNVSDRTSDRRLEVDQRPADRTVSIVEGPAANPTVVSTWDDDYSVGTPRLRVSRCAQAAVPILARRFDVARARYRVRCPE